MRKIDEQGFAHLVVVLIAVVVVGVVGFAGYTVMTKNKSSSSTNASTTASSGSSAASKAAQATGCIAQFHDANLCHFAAYSDISKMSYDATLKTTDPSSGSVSTMDFKSDGKGNSQLSGSGNGASSNNIVLNGNVYSQDTASGTWLEFTGANVPPTDQTNPTSSMDITVGSAGITYKSEGTVPCQGMTCYKYAVNIASTPNVKQTILFDTSSYKLREWDYSGGSQGSIVMTVSYPNVTITAPSPVQQMSVGQ